MKCGSRGRRHDYEQDALFRMVAMGDADQSNGVGCTRRRAGTCESGAAAFSGNVARIGQRLGSRVAGAGSRVAGGGCRNALRLAASAHGNGGTTPGTGGSPHRNGAAECGDKECGSEVGDVNGQPRAGGGLTESLREPDAARSKSGRSETKIGKKASMRPAWKRNTNC